ncbi:MAG: hypothetical protein LIO86_06670 [Lachnospiraceae bacterium]|nr:hypothetical protein [Lachnospiraceae bacterium]
MIRFLKDNKWTGLVILMFVVASLFYLCSIESDVVYGDGKEYILQTVSFQNHFSFGITESDLEDAQEEFFLLADDLESEYYGQHMHSYGNARYSNHYGSYSAFVAFVKWAISDRLGLYPVRAFHIANLLLWLSALLVIWFFLKADRNKKFWLVVLSSVNPAFFYLSWTHSEIYIYSFVVIGLVFFYNKQFGRSIWFLSIAAMQNLGVLPFAMMVGLYYISEQVIAYVTVTEQSEKFSLIAFWRKDGLKIIGHGLFYIPGLIPIISTYVRFGSFSLVADVATESQYLIHKAADYLFDLNLGVFPYEPLILFAFFVIIFVGIKKDTRMALTHLAGVGGMLFIISNQRQINCGMQYIMRYNVWIIPVLIFYVVMAWNVVFRNRKNFLLLIEIGETLLTGFVIIYLYSWSGWSVDGNHLEFSPFAKALMSVAPEYYNPSHGIFYSRALHEEVYNASEPVVYYDSNGYAKKILLSKEAADKFYSDESDLVLLDASGKAIEKAALTNILTIDEGDFKYINLSTTTFAANKYSLGEVIYFTKTDYNAAQFVRSGLSNAEDWGTWTDGEQLNMQLFIDNSTPSFSIYIDVAAVYYTAQEISILLNGSEVYSQIIDGEEEIIFSVDNPETGYIEISILLPDCCSPYEVDPGSEDTRDLGIALRSMTIN